MTSLQRKRARHSDVGPSSPLDAPGTAALALASFQESDLTNANSTPEQLEVFQSTPLPLLLDLSAVHLQQTRKPLQISPKPTARSCQIWQEHENNPLIYSARLIADSQQPDAIVGIGTHDLISHCDWGAVQLQQAGNGHLNMHFTLPVQTPPRIARKLVEGIYSGFHCQMTFRSS